MRRRKKSRLKYSLIAFLLLMITGVSYAYLSSSLRIKGTITGNMSQEGYIIDPSSNPKLELTNLAINKWESGNLYSYQYSFSLKNNGDLEYDNFTISLTYNGLISTVNIWNYGSEINGEELKVVNNTVHLKANSSAEIGFIITTTSNNFKLKKLKLEANTKTSEVDSSKVKIRFTKTNSWGSYVNQYNVEVINQTGATITYWQITVPLNQAVYENGWNAIFSSEDSNLKIKNADYNGRLENGASATFGLQLKTPSADFVPSGYTVLVR